MFRSPRSIHVNIADAKVFITCFAATVNAIPPVAAMRTASIIVAVNFVVAAIFMISFAVIE